MNDQAKLPIARSKRRPPKTRVKPKNWVRADYVPATIPGYIGNPFIEVLPSIVDKIQLHDDLLQLPMFDAKKPWVRQNHQLISVSLAGCRSANAPAYSSRHSKNICHICGALEVARKHPPYHLPRCSWVKS
jgi:hypothetical protein